MAGLDVDAMRSSDAGRRLIGSSSSQYLSEAGALLAGERWSVVYEFADRACK
jgi:hypothetical protein